MSNICGFIVLRKPEFASTDMVKPNVQVGDKTYHGIDRARWKDLDVAYYERRLTDQLMPIWQQLNRDSDDFSGISLLKDYEDAKDVLHFSGDKSEIIAIWSPELEKTKGVSATSLRLEHLGIDCVCWGEWSLLLDGAYLRPELFADTISQLNSYGLLQSENGCERLVTRYLELSRSEVVEPLMQEPRFTNIRVYRVAG